VAIVTGFVVLYGMITARRFDGWTSPFLATTVATSVTGFFFPFERFLPSHAIGILSLLILAVAYATRSVHQRTGAWGRTYVATSVLALYLNVFVLIVQLFRKAPSLQALAPTQTEPPFQFTQLAVLILFAVLGTRAAARFRREPARTF
jgi:hypothetical protein